MSFRIRRSITNATINATLNSISNITDENISQAAQIDATKISSGTVNNTAFNFVSGLDQGVSTSDNVTFTGTTIISGRTNDELTGTVALNTTSDVGGTFSVGVATITLPVPVNGLKYTFIFNGNSSILTSGGENIMGGLIITGTPNTITVFGAKDTISFSAAGGDISDTVDIAAHLVGSEFRWRAICYEQSAGSITTSVS